MPDVQESLIEDEVIHCNDCGSEHSSEEAADECCPTFTCERCGNEHSDEDGAYECCRYYCPSCSSEYRYSEEAHDCCRYMCGDCGQSWDYEDERDQCCRPSGTCPELRDMVPYAITVPVIEGRPARLCSLEQELAAGGAVVADMLYEHGHSQDNYVRGYHSSSRAGAIHVEEDGSLPREGGEVVYDRFNLSNESDSLRLSDAVTKIRQLRDEHQLVKTSFAAGIHIHVSARTVNGDCLSTRDMAALYELWCYAEDMLYSLSASGWNRHRQPTDDYGGYCKAVPKVEGTATPAKVWRAMRADRYYGLNFQRLFQAATNCSCGAGGMGDWQDCTCSAMDRATVEWRVFNASTLPRTIHAWLLLAHAITAYAASHEVGTLEQNPYGSQSKTEKQEVLDWLLSVLPLTEGEKDVIREAANRSPGL